MPMNELKKVNRMMDEFVSSYQTELSQEARNELLKIKEHLKSLATYQNRKDSFLESLRKVLVCW